MLQYSIKVRKYYVDFYIFKVKIYYKFLNFIKIYRFFIKK